MESGLMLKILHGKPIVFHPWLAYAPQASGSKSCGDDPFVKRINGGGHTIVHCVEEHK